MSDPEEDEGIRDVGDEGIINRIDKKDEFKEGDYKETPEVTSTPYDDSKVFYIRLTIILAIVLWVFLIVYIELYKTDGLGMIILMIPIVIFLISYVSAPYLDEETEELLFDINFLTVGLIILIPLLTWIGKNDIEDRKRFITLSIIAIIFAVLSLLDVWVPKYWVTIVRHVKSCFEVISATLMIYAIYTYHLHHCDHVFRC